MIVSQVDVTGIREVERRLGELKDKAPVALCRAINDAVSKTRTEMKKVPQDEFHVQQSGVYKELKPHKASKSNLKGAVSASGERIDLYKFKRSLASEIVKAAVIKPNSPKALEKGEKRAFIVTVGKDHKGIFERQGLLKKRKTRKAGLSSRITKHNESIRELTGLSAPQMLNNKEAIKRLEGVAGETLNNRLQHHVDYILQRG